MKPATRQAILWALGTAIVSGVSIYVNKFGVMEVNDPFVYATLKNSIVAVGFLAVVGLLVKGKELRALTRRQWAAWIGLGLIGGSAPFLLFFQGLTGTSAASASLIQKTLFIWVALLAVPVLGERLGWWQVAGLGVIAAGQFLLQPLTNWRGWGIGETWILLATLLWALETILAKKVLGDMSPSTAALGRMGIGALVMWMFLAFTGRAESALALNGEQSFWVMITALLLIAYVWTWYTALKYAPAVLVTSVLTVGAIITILLASFLDRQALTIPQIAAMSLLVLGIAFFVVAPQRRWQARAEGA